MKNPKVLVVDDEEIIRIGCQRILNEMDMNVELAENGEQGFDLLNTNSYDLVLLDLIMPKMDGMHLLEKIQDIDPEIVTIIITGFVTIENAVEAIQKGAYDYLPKPFTPDEFRAKVNRGLEKRRLLLEAKRLRQELDHNLLECSKEKTRTLTIINCMSEGLIATNRMGQIVLMNPAASSMLRLKHSHIIGKTIESLLGNPELEHNIQDTLEKVAESNTYKRLQITTRDNRVLQANITAIIDENDNCLGTVTVLLDLTEEKKVEKLKSEFVRMVSHELKAPIGAIVGYLNLILDGYTNGNPDRERDIVHKSRDKAENLLHLIHDLLDLSRAEFKEPSTLLSFVDVVSIIEEIIDFYQNQTKEKNIALELTVEEKCPNIQGSKEELSHLFSNLIGNAIKYTPKDGSVKIHVRQSNGYLLTTISDTGIGVGKEDIDKIFDEFYRASNARKYKIGGTGLGLSISKRIVERHQGYIDVQSEKGKGSTFNVFLQAIDKV